jgi:glutaminase
MLSAEHAAGERNRAIASLLVGAGLVEGRDAALELYLQQCCVEVDAVRLARMAATLANGGTNPLTGRTVLPPDVVRSTLSLMATCGHHDESGRVAVELGLPAKSGISGAVLAVAPGRMGLAAWSPAVNAHGTSVRGLAALSALARELGLATFGADGR